MTDDALRRSLFAGGGDLGEAMAGRDWAETALGPPEEWPAALRNTVRIMLTSRFAMWAGWGPELAFLYNDAYLRDTLQSKHPWALGRPASEVWAEIWHDIEPRVRSVLDTGVATWDEDLLLFLERRGFPEETYHTFSYSPLDGDDGRTEGLFCVVTETTDQVIGERRMATLRDLSAALAPARTRQQVLAAAGGQLADNLADLPFSAVYLYDDDGTARLGATAGIDPEAGILPTVLALDDPRRDPESTLRAGSPLVVDGLRARFPDLPSGAWDRAPDRAAVVPLTTSGQGPEDLAGFLAVGLNPHRPYDEGYAGFVGLVAHQISAALINADSYEAERERAEALAELDRAKTDFFSNVSHEFRTPLTLIMGPIADLRAAEDLSASRVREELEVIERNAQRLGKLVNTLLDFSRLQAGRIDARFEPVDLAAATSELASVFRSAVARAGLDYVVDCAPLPEPVHVDRDMWEKVVLNLLSNALKHTFEGGITVRLRAGAEGAVLTVADTGIGIPEAELPRLFERFTRVAGARSRSGEGSGIGLAMVRELVGLHGGTVTAQSSPGAGTTFTVTLPVGTAHLPEERLAPPTPDAPAVSGAATPFVTEALRWLPAADDADETPRPEVPDGAAAAPAGRVLVADDNADMRGYLVRLLAPRYAVTAVADGQQALDAARAAPPDLVVSDVMMPVLDGMELLAELRADPRTSRVPVLLLSARAGEEAAVEGLAAGADDYLVKPFAAQELLARVGAHVHLGRARREAEERFTAIADLAPALIWVSDREGGRLLVNAGWTAFTGRDAGAELGDGWAVGVHPDDRERYRAEVTAARAEERGWEVEFRLRRADGAYAWLLERAVPIGVGRAAAGYVGVCTDISARHRETERLALLAEVGGVLERERTVDGQLSALSRLLVDRRIADVATARVVDEEGRLRFAGIAGLDPAAEAAVASLSPETGFGPEVIRTGRTVLAAQLPWPPPGRADVADAVAVGSGMAVPLSAGGRVLAVLGLARQADSLPFDEDDRALVEEVAARAALAVDNVLLLAEERATARRLAVLQRVTAELSAATTPAEVAGVAASALTGLTTDGGRVGVYEVDPAQRALVALAMSGGTSDDTGERAAWTAIPLSSPIALATAVTTGRPQWVETADERLVQREGLTDGQVRSILAAPLAAAAAVPLTAGGRVLGVLGLAFRGAHSFPDRERDLLLAVAEQIALALDRARLYRAELDIATTLQRSLLPAALPPLAGLALAAEYLPGAVGSSAGGDWYDVVELDADRVAIAVGDVVGQGPSAAAVMGQLRSALSAALLQGCPPAAALELLDRFAARLPGALASSAACLVVDRAAGRVRWARAGHPPPLLVTGEGVTPLDGAGSGSVLGVPDRAAYTEGTAEVAPGTTLVLYTDGLVERRGESLDAGLARITDAAGRHAADDPELLVRHLLADVLADTDRPDDVAVIAARVLPPPLAERLAADPARLSRIRRTVTAWTAAAGVPADSVDDLQLALGEALANAVEHAYAGSGQEGECEYSLDRDPDGSIRVRVRDNGTWRPPPADKGFRGRGLELIGALASDVGIGPAPGGGTEVLFRIVPAPADAAVVDPPPAEPVPEDGEATLAVRPGPVLELAGELDLAAVSRLRGDVLAAAAGAGGVLELDLRRVGYLASAGVGLLLETAAAVRAAGGRVHVRTMPGSAAERVLRLSGLPDGLVGDGD